MKKFLLLLLIGSSLSSNTHGTTGVNMIELVNPSAEYTGPRQTIACELKSFNRLPDAQDRNKTISLSVTCGTFPPQSIWVQLNTPDRSPFKPGAQYDADRLDRYVSLTTPDGLWKSVSGQLKIEKISSDGKSIRLRFQMQLENHMGAGAVTAQGVIEGTSQD